MPRNGYDGPITFGAGVTRLMDALRAKGFTGPMGFTRANIKNLTGASIYFARRSDVSDAGGTKGREIADQVAYNFQPSGVGVVDLYQTYIYSAAGGSGEFSGDCR